MDIPQFISTLVGGHLGSTMDILICVLWQTRVHTSTVYTYRVGLLGTGYAHVLYLCMQRAFKIGYTKLHSHQEYIWVPVASYCLLNVFLNAIIVHEEMQRNVRVRKEKEKAEITK